MSSGRVGSCWLDQFDETLKLYDPSWWMKQDDFRIRNAEQTYSIIANFLQLEQQLLDCMDYIPFTADNHRIVSPKFTPIILEGCSLTESIFKRITNDGDRHTIKTYASRLDPRLDLSTATTIFLAPSLGFLRPFRDWTSAPPFWWTAYNKIKHDRIGHHDIASYLTTVNTLAALHQVIARSTDVFLECIAKAGWLNPDDERLSEYMVSRYVGCPPPEMPVESRLFVSATRDSFVIYEGEDVTVDHGWNFSARVKIHLWENDER